MSRNIVSKRTRAKKEIWEIAEYIARDDWQAAERFLDALKKSFDFLLDFPQSGELLDRLDPRFAEIRIWQVQGFPNHLIIFRPRSDGIEVIHVCHASQDLDALLAED